MCVSSAYRDNDDDDVGDDDNDEDDDDDDICGDDDNYDDLIDDFHDDDSDSENGHGEDDVDFGDLHLPILQLWYQIVAVGELIEQFSKSNISMSGAMVFDLQEIRSVPSCVARLKNDYCVIPFYDFIRDNIKSDNKVKNTD